MPNIAPWATNAFGVQVKPIDYSNPQSPTTKIWHATSIVANGFIIGRISNWQVNAYTRQVNHVREVSHATWGRPVDIVPGISEGYEITFDRAEVWSQEMELALGFGSVFDDLADQDRPFEIFEYLFRGQALYSVWQYQGCWLQSRNESARTADGDGIIKIEGGSIKYVKRSLIRV